MFSFAEYGLQVALNSTDVLYHNKATALLDMTNADLESMFSGVVTKLPLQPGTTVLEAAMAAKCFPNNRTFYQSTRFLWSSLLYMMTYDSFIYYIHFFINAVQRIWMSCKTQVRYAVSASVRNTMRLCRRL